MCRAVALTVSFAGAMSEAGTSARTHRHTITAAAPNGSQWVPRIFESGRGDRKALEIHVSDGGNGENGRWAT
jgi:hypothetical protein